jgi:F0F1-type ATP synthase membrane subunit b/b'
LIRFLAEAEAVASIKHPHVVQVHEYGEVDGRPFLTLEYLPGGTLADKLKNEKRLEPKIAAKLVAKLARAVQDAHDQGIVHRDLKPANVLFDAEGEPKVTDFGLAKRAKGTDLTQTQAVMGTPAYMSPEQAKGQTKFVGPPADIYALGVILYECLAGVRPFQEEDTRVLLWKVIDEEPTKPSKHTPGLPRDLELIALKCLAKDPADRYATAKALAEDLTHFTAGEPVSVRAAGTIERTLKWAKRKPTQAAAYLLTFAVVVLMAFGVSLTLLYRKAVDERQQAVAARIGESTQREKAEAAQTAAESARDAEKKAKDSAEQARDEARKAEGEVREARDKVARVEYGRTMQVAHQEWRENNRAASLALLKGTNPGLRGWEWRYVQKLWGDELLSLKGHTDDVKSVSWSPDGSRIATASSDETARVWDAKSGAELLMLKGHTGSVTSVSWSPNGSHIATTSQDGTARVWDARSGAEVLTLNGHT